MLRIAPTRHILPDHAVVMASNLVIHLADCDVWRVDAFENTLSAEDRSRADRYRRSVDRNRFVVRRGLLRRLIAGRLGCPPGDVPLRVGPHGRPFLETSAVTAARPPIAQAFWPAFNLSRSGGRVLYALEVAPRSGLATGPGAAERPAIGVDLERVAADRRTIDDLLRIAGHFAPKESLLLRALPPVEATAAFYRFWTCKEACLKSLGTGIGGTGAPTLAEVALEIDSDGGVRRARWPRGGLDWRLVCLEPCPGHAAAVALPAGCGRDVNESEPVLELLRLEPDAADRRHESEPTPP